MNKLILILLGVTLALATVKFAWERKSSLSKFDRESIQMFSIWKQQHGKSYNSLSEEFYRLNVFLKNHQKLKELRNSDITYSVGLNKFSDLPEEEFLQMYAGYSNKSTRQRKEREVKTAAGFTAPSSIDWRKFNAVNPIRDQKNCNAGYAFASVAAFESGTRVSGYSLYEFSDQQVVDCSSSDGNFGCQGGDIGDAFEYILRVGGLENGLYYPFSGTAGTCKFDPSKKELPRVEDWYDVPKADCNGLMTAVAQQPVAAAVAASAMQFYQNGVFSSKFCGTSINHAVTVIGYGTDSTLKKNFWLVRNSWGEGWGEEGYIRMDRDVQTDTGICGICLAATYPQII